MTAQLLDLACGGFLLCAVLVLWRREIAVIVRVFAVQGALLAVMVALLAVEEGSVELAVVAVVVALLRAVLLPLLLGRALAEAGPGRRETHRVDRVVAHVGHRPDRSIHRELQVHECYASEAPMKLAVALLEAGSTDCLSQPPARGSSLESPEPGFFILGAKSYGRGSTFLLRTGYEQVADVLARI